jgi:hypothetical protein
VHFIIPGILAGKGGRNQIGHDEGLAWRGIDCHVPISRGNDDDIAFVCFDENDVIQIFCLEEEMGNPVQDFIYLRVAGS